MSRSLRELYESSPFSSAQAPYVEEQFERYLSDPASVSQEWRAFFGPFGSAGAQLRLPTASKAAEAPRQIKPPTTPAVSAPYGEKQSAVSRLIQFYANRGHLIAD